ncbi:uncharacterized protein LOC143248147 [Tachypleus tridentatus]|uniref:uncharacterized protein LOC143248147 n=1 Tax=Tachypleus tridentatus TaxID=6853 RepID=UPI003FD37DC0
MQAFDRVVHDYLFQLLVRMGFGSTFVHWVRLCYTSISSCVKFNGFLTNGIAVTRGIRQGCPMSALLYVFSVEPLRNMLAHNVHITGIGGDVFLNTPSLIYQHVDDSTLTLRTPFPCRTCWTYAKLLVELLGGG